MSISCLNGTLLLSLLFPDLGFLVSHIGLIPMHPTLRKVFGYVEIGRAHV